MIFDESPAEFDLSEEEISAVLKTVHATLDRAIVQLADALEPFDRTVAFIALLEAIQGIISQTRELSLVAEPSWVKALDRAAERAAIRLIAQILIANQPRDSPQPDPKKWWER